MSTPSAELTPAAPLFPACRRPEPLGPFAVRWLAKREDHDLFLNALTTVNAQLPLGWRLPDELVDDWLAQWVSDVFVGGITCRDRMSPEEVRAGVRDVTAVVDAVLCVDRYSRLESARRFWFYELARELDWGGFPTVEQVAKGASELDPRRDLEDLPGHESLGPRYDQRQFFATAAFVGTGLAPEQQAWLRRLAYRADPHERLWSAPPRQGVWVRNQFRTAVPALATCLGVGWPPLGAELPMEDLLREVRNWLTDRAEPALAPVPNSPPVLVVPTGDARRLALLGVYTNGVANERIAAAMRIAADETLSVDEKLWRIHELAPIPETVPAEQLANVFGVTASAVTKTTWWKRFRKGKRDEKVAERKALLEERTRGLRDDAPDDE